MTVLLLQAGYYDDALTYFCHSTGATTTEATQALAYLEQDIDDGNIAKSYPHTPDPGAIQFLLRTNHKVTAIQYYRNCTGGPLIEVEHLIDAHPPDASL